MSGLVWVAMALHSYCVSNAIYRPDCHGNAQKYHGWDTLEAKLCSKGDMELGKDYLFERSLRGDNGVRGKRKYGLKLIKMENEDQKQRTIGSEGHLQT